MVLFVQIWLLAVLELLVIFFVALLRARAGISAFGPLVFGFIRHQPKPTLAMLLSLAWFNWIGFGLWAITFGNGWWFK